MDADTKPLFSEFQRMAKKGDLIPVYREFLADTETPVTAYLKIHDRSFSYLLESAEKGKRWGRYSFIGYKPLLIARYRGQEMEVWGENGRREVLSGVENPLRPLRDLLGRFKPMSVGDPIPFQGGLVGYFNYDLIRKWENLPGISPGDANMPECLFVISSRLIIFDHLTQRIRVVAFAHVKEEEGSKEIYERVCREVEETIHELKGPLPSDSTEVPFSLTELKANFSKEKFQEAVLKAKDYIVAGDVIQVVLSQSFSGEVSGNDFNIYRNLRSVNPSPYMFYLNFGDTKLIGSSPEVLVRLEDGKIELRPIAGTRPRGRTLEEDQEMEKELMADPKERAEHIMLVDLGRNDVGKVAMPASVTVPSLMEVERYSHVMHMVSSVQGILRPGTDSFDLFMSAFPAGTVTGAPKIRAMEIIRELEPSARGPYAGAAGYFALNGNMDFCIIIRTIVIVDGRISIQVGAGIVADSSPEREYEETLRKAGAMFKAIGKET